MTTDHTPVHPDPKVQQRRWWILAILSISVFLVVVDNLIINVAIPTLARELGATTSGLQWIVDSYALVFAGLLLACGGLGDRFGRKIVMQIGMVLFGVFSAWAAFTDTTEQLIIGRGLMGIGAALVFPSTLAILIDVFRHPVERAKAIGVWSAVSGAAVAFSPPTSCCQNSRSRRGSWQSIVIASGRAIGSTVPTLRHLSSHKSFAYNQVGKTVRGAKAIGQH